MRFEPIAIVGRACLFPGALDAAAFARVVLEGRDCVSACPDGRWRVSREHVLAPASPSARDKAFSDRGGYVTGFEGVFDPGGFAIPEAELVGLDPLVLWLLHTARQALRDAGVARDACARTGAVVGNLSLPSEGLARFVEAAWLEAQEDRLGAHARERAGLPRPDARNRFMSGLPAHLVARALSLGGGAFALDAACASSLYAIKYACDRLHDRRADVMLAGAVNGADPLFLHVGFSALQALSGSGRSRPFHRDADGLLPAEGAAFVALKRLSDAAAAGDRIYGVIRGVGLGNDGRGAGLLVPSEAGQERALRAAYAAAGLQPADISLLECHATGTAVGDATEIRSLSRLYHGLSEVAIGSVKSNIGHPITASGLAGLLKVLAGLEAGMRPQTLHAEPALDALAGSPFRLCLAPEPWSSAGPRRAAVSSFGFGGNNAHLLVEEWRENARDSVALAAPPLPADPPAEVAIVSVSARVGKGRSSEDFARLVLGAAASAPAGGLMESLELELAGLRFPPSDLDETLPQQLLLLAVAREAVAGLTLPRERTAVLAGMQCDTNVARYGGRLRILEWVEAWTEHGAARPDAAWLRSAQDAFHPPLLAASVLGCLPNIVANRINSQLDLAGPSAAISAEELSGIRALELARRALLAGEIDAALVCAVDLCGDAAHARAARELLGDGRGVPGDAAVVLVLKRLEDARRDGDPVVALVDDAEGDGDAGLASELELGTTATDLTPLLGHAHAASGLLHAAIAAIALERRSLPGLGAPTPWPPGPSPRTAMVSIDALGAAVGRVRLREQRSSAQGWAKAQAPRLGAGVRTLGPSKNFTAHRPPVRIAAPPAASPQLMARAPSLPAILREIPEPLAAATSVAEHSLAAAYRSHQRLRNQAQDRWQAAVGRIIDETQRDFIRASGAALQGFTAAFGSRATARPVPLSGAVVLESESPAVEPVRPVSLSRKDLEAHAGGRISAVFGPLFERQDAFRRQVRMPLPPLLLADRVTEITGPPGVLGRGSVRTETDVPADAFYLHDGRMPAGIMIEAGQADLLLISWMGIDFLNRGERVYRLLGCEMTFHGSLPRPGDTLAFDIHVDSHAQQGDIRLFFFHYDCRIGAELRLSVRNGQAGFFTDEELAASGGVLWDPETAPAPVERPLDPPVVPEIRRAFDRGQLRAFSEGRIRDCFGPGYAQADAHVKTPRSPAGRMALLHDVERLDPAGGPWGRGYLRARWHVSPEDWFFDGHFKDDPCMPGTLMFEGCIQAMAFYMTALGFTLERDGWRFEPVQKETYLLRCRGQVLPSSKELVYELFISEATAGPSPVLYADLLGNVDGRKAFHCGRMGVRLVPDW